MCEECYGAAPDRGRGAARITGTTVYTLQRIVASSVEKLYTFNVSEPVLRELERVVSGYFAEKVDKTFPSAEMLSLTESFPM